MASDGGMKGERERESHKVMEGGVRIQEEGWGVTGDWSQVLFK